MTRYLAVSGTVFGLIALLHLLRVVTGWHVTVAVYSVPLWFSIIAIAVFSCLAGWAVRLSQHLKG
jgi:hypothetical protein